MLPSESFDDRNVNDLVDYQARAQGPTRAAGVEVHEVGDDDLFEEESRAPRARSSGTRGLATVDDPSTRASASINHPRFMTGSPVTQTTYTARRLDEIINERLREKDAE